MDIYDIAVKLALVNGVSGGLNVVTNQFTNERLSIRSMQNVLRSFQAALGVPIEWRGGTEVLHGFGKVADAAEHCLTSTR